MTLFGELKRRKVFKVGVAYLVVAWLAVQAASIGFPAFDAPAAALRLFILAAALGFPLMLVLAWVVDVTPEGLRLDPATSGNKRLASVALLMVVLALGWYFQGLEVFHRQAAPAAAPAIARDASIAVLPFVNIGADRDQDYFSDGLSEELLNQLAQLPQLRVIARSSSFSFKGKDVDVGTIARSLGVAHVLEGSVRRSGDVLRITAQLIRASDGSHLWSARYDRRMTDVLAVQDEIAAAVVDALSVHLFPRQRLTSPHASASAEAYDHYLLGTQLANRANEDDYRSALKAFQHAIELDPKFAAAYAGLGYVEVFLADYAATAEENAAAQQRALAAADKAIALGPDVADGYAVRGWMRANFVWDWQGARSDLRQALALDPNNSTTHRRYGQLLASLGRMPEALAEIRRATEVDPLSAPAWSNLGFYLMTSGDQAAARKALERTLLLNPDSVFAQANFGFCELLDGHPDAALVRFRRVDPGYGLYGVAIAEHSLGHAAAADKALRELIARYGLHWMQVADVYAWRGDKDKAFEWLDRAYAERDGGMSDIKVDPMLANLRDDPRYAALLRRMRLPE